MQTLFGRFCDCPAVVTREVDYGSGWWEEGTVILPAESWKIFRRNVCRIYNEHQEWLYQKAVLAFESVTASRKGRMRWDRAFNKDETVRRMTEQVANMIRPALFFRANTKMYLPGRRRFPNATLSIRVFRFAYDAYVVLDDETRTFNWSLRAKTGYTVHSIPAIVEMFDIVSSIQYNRTSGGVIRTKAGDIGFGPLGAVLV